VGNALITIDCRGQTLFGVNTPDGLFVGVKPLCDQLGLNWRKQVRRMRSTPVLAEGMLNHPLPTASGPQPTTLLHRDLVPAWLLGISLGHVARSRRDRVLTYQRSAVRNELFPAAGARH